ncbi:MAG: acetolactate synthase [Planctomycetota bacterium]|nr:acetolactate synthase [Planctomycetota bacterium]
MAIGKNDGSGSSTGFRTARGRDWPSVRQFNVFVANRVGGLMRVVRWFEMTDIRIVSISIVDSADCAIIRLVLSNPERATEIFAQANLPFTESDLLIVKLPTDPQPLLLICKALLEAEVNIHYAYPLLIGPSGNSALALYVEDHETATSHEGLRDLRGKVTLLYTEKDLDQDE